MAKAEPHLIANRFELIIIVLLCFVVSNRLIWLHVDQPLKAITSEFYSTSLAFNQTLSRHCALPLAHDFPQPEPNVVILASPTSPTSPGLALTFLGLCQFDRLDAGSLTNLAPQLITSSAFLTSITARLLTNSWVGGVLAAAVILSRGSVLAAADHAGSFMLLQPIACMFFLLLALYGRIRSQLCLYLGILVSLVSVLVAPVMSIVITPALLLLEIPWKNDKAHTLHTRSWSHMTNTIVALMLMLFLLNEFASSSMTALAVVRDQFLRSFGNHVAPHQIITNTWGHVAEADMHWQISLASISIAAVLSRYFPAQASLTFKLLLVMVGLACFTDGITSKIGPPATDSDFLWGIGIGLDPIVLGLGAAVTWHGLRLLLMTLIADYSRPAASHDNM